MLNKKNQKAFTIVELLVVIVVIGILAAITIVGYTGISKKAAEATSQSDLSGAKRIMELYKVDNSYYPDSMTETSTGSGTYCPAPPDPRYCVKSTPGNTLKYVVAGPSPLTYSLYSNNTNAGINYVIANDTAPSSYTPTPVTAIAAITGTNQVDSILTAGALTPSGATVNYQWQRADT